MTAASLTQTRFNGHNKSNSLFQCLVSFFAYTNLQGWELWYDGAQRAASNKLLNSLSEIGSVVILFGLLLLKRIGWISLSDLRF